MSKRKKMANYKIKIKYETEVEAEDEEWAMADFFENMAVENIDPATWIGEHAEVILLCGNCGREAEHEAGGVSRCGRCKEL